MQRTRIIATEETVGTSAGAATSISTATCVRLSNTSGTARVIAVSETVGAASSTFFTMPDATTEFLEKEANHVIWADGAVKANKVGFTN
jgi:AICAR transformylase/IMP cyclohydrolase PurH